MTASSKPSIGVQEVGGQVSPSLAKPSVAKQNLNQVWPVWPTPSLCFQGRGGGEGSRHPGGPGGAPSENGALKAGEGERTQKNVSPKSGPQGWVPKGGAPKISRFFFPLPPQFSCFLPSLGCLLAEFWWCFEDPAAPTKVARVSRNSPKSPNMHI